MEKVKQLDDFITKVQERNEELQGSSSLGSTTLLSFPMWDDSARMNMFSSHLKQSLVLNKTEFPKVFTNFENIIGEYSSYNHRAKSDYEVIDIIEKFPEIESGKDIQTILYILYNKKEEMYDVFAREDVVNLTEKYGFQNDNSALIQYHVNDVIKEGATLSRPTSYDEFDNYGFGRNIKFMYQINQDTIEDAIVVSETLAKQMESTEVEEVKVPINDNDFLANLYGDKEYYKSFPDIGESTKEKIFCAKKRINKSQILYDLKYQNVKRILGSDVPLYIEGVVTDIDIYFNKPIDQLNRGVYNEQLNRYITMIYNFYKRVEKATQKCMDSGKKCSNALLAWHKRVTELTTPGNDIKDEMGNTFSNIIMYARIKRKSGLYVGQKLTGRHGNKGVISKILPDYMMPHLENGEVVHIIFNTLGVFNRLNIFQLYEQSINFITERIVEKFKKENMSIKEMEDITFKVIDIFNHEQCEQAFKTYKEQCKTKKDKEYYFNVIKEYGIHIHIKPYWHLKNIYDSVQECYDTFPWIQPYKVYFYEPHSKRWVKMMQDQIVGSMYVMKLKQSSKKNMSACSNASINNLGLPEKTDSAKKHKTPYSKTPVRSGLQETINNMISIPSETSARMHMYYRNSPVARKQLGTTIVNNYGKGLPIEPVMTTKMTNRNVEILSSYLKIMGLEMVFENDTVYLTNDKEGFGDDKVYCHKYKGADYIGTAKYMMDIITADEARRKVEEGDVIWIGRDGKEKEHFLDELAEKIEDDILNKGIDQYFEEEAIY